MNRQNPQSRFSPIARFSFSAALLVLLSACDQTGQLPIGAELRISPETRSITVADNTDQNGNCFVDPNNYIDMPIILSMVDSNGSPLGEIDVSVYVDFSGNTFPGTPVMELFDDLSGNNNGVIDEFELVSGVDDDIAIVTTDSFDGDRPLLLRINVTCPFRGDVFAFSDGVSAVSTIEIIAEQSTEQTIQ